MGEELNNSQDINFLCLGEKGRALANLFGSNACRMLTKDASFKNLVKLPIDYF